MKKILTIEGKLNCNTPNHVSLDNKKILYINNNNEVCIFDRDTLEILIICKAKTKNPNPFWLIENKNDTRYRIIFNVDDNFSSVYEIINNKPHLLKDINYCVLNVNLYRVAFASSNKEFICIYMLNNVLLNKNPSIRLKEIALEDSSFTQLLFLTKNKFIVELDFKFNKLLIFSSKTMKFTIPITSHNIITKITPNLLLYSSDNAIRYFKIKSKTSSMHWPGYTILNTKPYNFNNLRSILLYDSRNKVILRTATNKKKPIQRIFSDTEVTTASYDMKEEFIFYSTINNKIHFYSVITRRDEYNNIIYEGLTEVDEDVNINFRRNSW